MDFRQQLAAAAPKGDTVFTIGVFDGAHLGHRHLLRRLLELARLNDFQPGVVTFVNHPATVLRPNFPLRYLTTPEQKIQLLRQMGLELVIPLEFTPELAQVTADEFTQALVKQLRLRGLVIGPDFTLGRNRQGDGAYLRQRGLDLGFWVEVVEPLLQDGTLVKSRLLREVIAQGQVDAAARYLGRQFSLTGVVMRGDGRGRLLGFPTANIAVAPQLILPADGIYATWITINGQRYPSATSIGVRPTFDLAERLIETYVIDFHADLYGQTVTVQFVDRLRGQEKFASVDALIDQIAEDVAGARLALARDEGVQVA